MEIGMKRGVCVCVCVGVGVIPIVKVGEEKVLVFFPIALLSNGIGGRSGSSTVLMIGHNSSAEDDSDIVAIFLFELINIGVHRCAGSTLVVAVLIDDDWGVRVALNILGEIATSFVGFENLERVIDIAGKIGDIVGFGIFLPD